jgi:hypothetical protein
MKCLAKKMDNGQDLRRELKAAKDRAKTIFESQTIEPSSGGIGMSGVNTVGAFIDAAEWKEAEIRAYEGVFKDRGEKFTRGYVEGRRRNPLNFFSRPYKAATRVLNNSRD